MKKTLQDLPTVAPEMLAGLHADAKLRARILSTQRPSTARLWIGRAVPLGVAAVIAVVGTTSLLRKTPPITPGNVMPIDVRAAGGVESIVDPQALNAEDSGDEPVLLADVPEGSLSVDAAGDVSAFRKLFVGKAGDFPLVGYNGAAYRMLTSPSSLRDSALGDPLGTVAAVEDPSQADWSTPVSNAAEADSTVYAVSGLSSGTAVVATVDGKMRLFQRYSYGNFGPGGSLESVLDVRGKVNELDLSGVGKITDSGAANALIDTLLDNASMLDGGVTSSKQALNIKLQSGLTLQLFVSGDTFSACGSWSCPGFIDAYRAALGQ